MQLKAAPGNAPVRRRLGAAACALLASAAATARAEGPAGTQLDAAMLIYGEQGRTNVVEPRPERVTSGDDASAR